jgi:hypothetical protein
MRTAAESARRAAEEEAQRRKVEHEAARRAADEQAARRAADEQAARRAAEKSAAQAAAAELERQSDLEPAEAVVEPQPQLVLAPFTAPPTPTEPVAGDRTEPEIAPLEPQTARAEEPGAQTADLPIYRWFGNS